MKTFLLCLVLALCVQAADFTWVGLPYSTGGSILQDYPQTGVGTQLQAGQYQVDNHKRVWFRGVVTCTGGGIDGNTLLFVLPAAFAPKNYVITSITQDNGGGNELQINPDGSVLLRGSFACTPDVNFLDLEGANYSIE